MIAGYLFVQSPPQPVKTIATNSGKVPVGKRIAYRRHIAMLAALLLVPILGAWAADDPVAQRGPASPYFSGALPVTWQFGIGYQFERPYLKGAYSPFITNGVNVSVDRYFNRFLAIEGDEGDGFGHYQPHQSFGSIFLGGGLHLAFHNPSRFEPWAHGLFGLSYYNFALPQPPPLKSLASSWVFGGGVDYRLRGGFALRGEGDYLGTHFGGAFQTQPRIVVGLVWNF